MFSFLWQLLRFWSYTGEHLILFLRPCKMYIISKNTISSLKTIFFYFHQFILSDLIFLEFSFEVEHVFLIVFQRECWWLRRTCSCLSTLSWQPSQTCMLSKPFSHWSPVAMLRRSLPGDIITGDLPMRASSTSEIISTCQLRYVDSATLSQDDSFPFLTGSWMR